MSKTYVLGLDGGGTSTKSLALDLDGGELLSFEAGSINVNGSTEEDVIIHINTIFEKYTSALGNHPEALVIGSAGLTNVRQYNVLNEALKLVDYRGKLYITGDQNVALMGALGKREGALLISGTGSISYGFNQAGEEIRVGGFGHLVDDFGSAYDIGRQIIVAVIQANDGRAPETILRKLVFEHLNITEMSELIEFVYTANRPKSDFADLAVLSTKASDMGDEVAFHIQDNAIESLAKIVEATATRMKDESFEMTFAGSVLTKNEYIRNGLKERIKNLNSNIDIIEPRHDAAYGAAMMALELGRGRKWD